MELVVMMPPPNEVTITIVPDPEVSISIDDNILCLGETATLTATTEGGFNCADVSWTLSEAGGAQIATATGAAYTVPANLAVGNYEVVAEYVCGGSRM